MLRPLFRPFCTVCFSYCIVLLIISLFQVDSKSLNAYEQAIGDWKVELSCSRKTSETLLFPLTKSAATSLEQPVARDAEKAPSCWKRGRVDCRLSIFTNGTFVLAPYSCKDGTEEVPLSLQHLPVRGTWELFPNPYCITDRYYDQLTLKSYPRVKKRGDNEILQTAQMRLDCHVCGRYGSGAVRKFLGKPVGRIGSRMNQGTLVWEIQQDGQRKEKKLPWWRKRRVCATFTGRPIEKEEKSTVLAGEENSLSR
jgi:hypothetical protein